MSSRNNPGPAKQADQQRKQNVRHPLLKIGTPHFEVWDAIKSSGNPNGGITSANVKDICPNFHPQVLADLQKAYLVSKNGKIGASFKYIADPNGLGIIPQHVQVEIEVYADADGNLMTRTYLHGGQENVGKPVKFLGSRKVKIDVPPGALGMPVTVDVNVDPEYDFAEVHKAKKTRKDANVIIDIVGADLGPAPDGPHEARLLSQRAYNPKEDDGCIIDQ